MRAFAIATAGVSLATASIVLGQDLRSHTPAPPLAYLAEEIEFPGDAAPAALLAGTLSLPSGPGPHPAVVLISGAGPHDRDETHDGGHKPFAVLSDHLVRNGIAVLRYDDRGTAASTGDFGSATWLDFAHDANAAVTYLLGRPDIERGSVGVIGHSEGGIVGSIAAADNALIAFLITMAAPSTDFVSFTLDQRRRAALAQGAPPEAIDRNETLLRAAFAVVSEIEEPTLASQRLNEVLAARGIPEGARSGIAAQLTAAPLRVALRHNPQRTLPRVEAPVLALTGSLDQVVEAEANLEAVRLALSHNPDVTVMKLDGLNHWFQNAATGSAEEVATLKETLAPAAMQAISNWIRARFLK